MKGKIVNEVPRAGRTGSIDWDSSAQLAKLTGKPVLAAEQVRNTTIKSVRQYTRPPFVTSEGRIIVEMRNSKLGGDGERYGDVYLSWEPSTTPTKESK